MPLRNSITLCTSDTVFGLFYFDLSFWRSMIGRYICNYRIKFSMSYRGDREMNV
jgi:hypothetical protein